jgi:peptidoglycan/xylan/chitin deacetylase (PgdA/CDA1 family)
MTGLTQGLNLLQKAGVFEIAHQLSPNFLTVLNYHRIDDPFRSGFDTFCSNVSATPADFANQMDYVANRYNVISGVELADCVKKRRKLPPHAAMITFDDGYYDNYSNAYPILKARNLPAIIFLATDYIGEQKPFYWDLIAYGFHHTKKTQADFPQLGLQSWVDDNSRNKAMQNWIAVLKRLTETEKQALVEKLPGILDVSVPADAFANLMMSWPHARELSENGIEMGGHTASHPILTRISPDDASAELVRSKQRIEEAIGKRALSFAYPNGQSEDFNADLMDRVRDVGFDIAFTLLSGPTRYSTVMKDPFAIRRIFLTYKDSFPRFVAKLTGFGRIKSI